ncbi:hypothetical protein QBC38DRAFT_513811 [Podospora fimiseda]|uniref:3-hydroxyacyl-CoA dehydrogenase n=1 Tax=Podospora fimiseda TaxID=252190 RepID=A0AAN6YKF8_9PEZI|nr:hypothetical protein QBC38DRAFT_513811 [Podospora fimiseda]
MASSLLQLGFISHSPHSRPLPKPYPPLQQSRTLLTNSFAPFFDPPRARTELPSTTWRPPSESALSERPVLIIGAGAIGRRIALVWASNSRPVTLYDISDDALKAATEYLTDHLGDYCAQRGTHPGHVCTTSKLRIATTTGSHLSAPQTEVEEIEIDSGSKGPWMAIECLPENLDLKVDLLSTMEHYLPRDCILTSNSSSLMTSEMAPRLHYPERLMNTHYFIPPRNTMVELMSSTKTHENIFPFLEEQMRRVGLRPMTVPKGIQSQGFIMNRIWAACKRETLAVLAEGVAKPEDVDALWRDFFHAEKGPCLRMDEVGLDTVAMVEKHNLERKPGLGSKEVVEWLERNYVKKGKLGEKCRGGKGDGDGLYTKEERDRLKESQRAQRFGEVEETQGA